jgi:hypothetical protein
MFEKKNVDALPNIVHMITPLILKKEHNFHSG